MWTTKRPGVSSTGNSDSKSSSTDAKIKEGIRPAAATPDFPSGWLGPSLRIKGDITGTQDLLIDGSVEGMIDLEGHRLTVGAAAQVTADVKAREVVVYGQLNGDVRATARIEIKRDGSVIGNLTTAQIMIEDGADFKGSIEIDRTKTKETSPLKATSASAGGA